MVRREWTEAEKREDALAMKEMLELLPYHGWPKWPPTPEDIPKVREWWTDERLVYPSPMKGAAGLNCFIEWTGLSKTGKSSTLQGVGGRLTDRGWKVRVLDEPVINAGEVYCVRIPPSYLVGMSETEFGDEVMWFRKDEPLGHYEMERVKVGHWAWEIEQAYQMPLPEEQIVIGVRGPVDAMVWMYGMAATRDNKFGLPEGFLKYWEGDLSLAQVLMGRISAAVVMGTNREEARQRRIREGKVDEGFLTGSLFWDDLSVWFGHWLDINFPVMHEMHGTGLFVPRSDWSLEETTERITDFCEESALRVLPRWRVPGGRR